MPDNYSSERIKLIKCYGAEVVLTNGSLGMKGAIDKANELNKTIKNSIICSQFTNPSNPKAHYETTAVEIFNDTDGQVDVFVASVGTGGTITGVGEYLKQNVKNVKVVAVEPESSPLLTRGISGSHKIQGIGANFIPSILNTSIYDEVLLVTDENAYLGAKLLAQKDGVLAGISSGAVLSAGIELAKREENNGKTIVLLLADTGERYLSDELF
jgi:cysteine synthase A